MLLFLPGGLSASEARLGSEWEDDCSFEAIHAVIRRTGLKFHARLIGQRNAR
jgi:hypothetical protein